jgi:polyferredoxin
MQGRPKRRSNGARALLPARRRSAAILWWLLPLFVIGGWFFPSLGLILPLCMLAPVVIAPIRGRFWCGWVCPRGSFFDYIMSRFSRNKPAPAWLRSKRVRLGALLFLMTMMTGQIALVWPDPQAIGLVLIRLLTVTTVVGVGLALAYKPRTWCSVCPMGTMASWFSHGKRPLTVNSACTNCPACTKLCPMGLTPQRPDSTHADCIKCMHCVTICPRKALTFEQPTNQATEQVLPA